MSTAINQHVFDGRVSSGFDCKLFLLSLASMEKCLNAFCFFDLYSYYEMKWTLLQLADESVENVE